jgi:hypothetical protein
MSYRCVLCEKVFDDSEMENALEISGGRGRSRIPITYLIDGNYHALRKVPVKKPKQPQPPTSEPKETTELLLEVANVLAALPTPPVPEPEPKTEPLPQTDPEFEEEQITIMRAAWLRRSK